MTFRLLDQAPQYLLRDGNVNAYGWLWTFENGTNILKTTWSDPLMTVPNENPIPLDAAGRTETDVWGDGIYTLRLEDFLHAEIWTRDDVQSGDASGSVFPPGAAGQFLTTDGTNVSFVSIRQVPDPTGQSGRFLTNDGVNTFWSALSAANGTLTITANSIKMSNGTSAIMLQWGSDTVAASGATTATKAFAFPTAFTTLYHVDACINGGPGVANPGGGIPTFGVGGRSVAGASMNIDTNAFGSTVNIVNPVPFSWFAVGAVAP